MVTKINSNSTFNFNGDKENSVLNIFNSIKTLDDINKLNKLIERGEIENEYLECKQADSANLGRGLKQQLAQSISALANNMGGIILIGVETIKEGNIDRLVQVLPIGFVEKLMKQIKLTIPLICEPPVKFLIKTVKEKEIDTKGIITIYIYPTSSDPVRSTIDKNFYLRIGGGDYLMPYETIKRMFLGSNAPDLYVVFDQRLIKIQKDGKWEIPIILKNTSNVPAEFVKVSVDFNSPEACQEIISSVFRDVSHVNPNRKIFMYDVDGPIYKGLNLVIGTFSVLMKKIKLPKRLLDITITLYAKNMRARYQRVKIYLYRRKFQIKELEKDYLY